MMSISFFEQCEIEGLCGNRAAIKGLSDIAERLTSIEAEAKAKGLRCSSLSTLLSFYLLPRAKGILAGNHELIEQADNYADYVGYFDESGELAYPVYPHKKTSELNLIWHKQKH
jgi:hypothetical protein